jgi:DNA-binding beta-propeller fold protein YncE
LALLIAGCSTTTESPFVPSGRTAWVVNSLGETLSKVNLDSGEVVVNAIPLDDAPNDIAVLGNRAYVVNSMSNNIQILDLTTEQTLGAIEILKGMNPYYIAIENSQRAFVSNWLTGNVSVLDLESETETDTIMTGGVPQGLCVTSDRLFVTDINLDLVNFTYGPGRLLSYSLVTLDLEGSLEVGMNPQIVELGPDGNLHVVCTGDFGLVSGQVYIVNPQTLTVELTIDIGGSPGSLAFNSQNVAYLGSVAWAGEGWLLTYDAITHQIIRGAANPIVLPSSAMDVACAQNDHIFAACFNTDQLIEIDEDDSIINTYTVGDGPIAVALKE